MFALPILPVKTKVGETMKSLLTATLVVLMSGVTLAGGICYPVQKRFQGYGYGYNHKAYVAPVKYVEKQVAYPQINVFNVQPQDLSDYGKTQYYYSKIGEYKSVDTALILDRLARISEGGVGLANAGVQGVVQTLREEKGRELNLRLQQNADYSTAEELGEFRQLLKEVYAAREQKTQIQSATININPEGGGSVGPGVLSAVQGTTLQNRCVECHEKYSDPVSLDDDDWANIFKHVYTGDMPRDPSDKSKPGKPLTEEEFDSLVKEHADAIRGK